MTSDKRQRPKSERPLSELKKERDAFIETFFKRGAQVESENATLRAQVASDEAIRELLRKIDLLEREKLALLSRFEEVEAESSRWGDQYHEVESELANLANLYIATNQLHGSLDVRTTLHRIKEL